MIFLIALVLTGIFIFVCAKTLKKHPAPFYVGAVVIALIVIGCTAGRVVFPEWFRLWIWPLVSRGALATALFAAVMYAAVLPNGSKGIKTLMPIRGELSILASILTLGHNLSYGRTYFRLLFTNPDRLPANQFAAAICSLIMLVIMLPLFVTSFKCIRRKMKPARWKKLQRFAYGFYALLYVHVLLLTLPQALAGESGYVLNFLIYSIVFVGYGICRVLKAVSVKKKTQNTLKTKQITALCCVTILTVCVTGGLLAAGYKNNGGKEENPDSSSAETGSAAEEARSYKDGVYTGRGKGFEDFIYVQVTIENHQITEIKITESYEDEPYFSEGKGVIASILEKQSPDVDAISGATYSSEGIKEAVQEALNSAME